VSSAPRLTRPQRQPLRSSRTHRPVSGTSPSPPHRGRHSGKQTPHSETSTPTTHPANRPPPQRNHPIAHAPCPSRIAQAKSCRTLVVPLAPRPSAAAMAGRSSPRLHCASARLRMPQTHPRRDSEPASSGRPEGPLPPAQRTKRASDEAAPDPRDATRHACCSAARSSSSSGTA